MAITIAMDGDNITIKLSNPMGTVENSGVIGQEGEIVTPFGEKGKVCRHYCWWYTTQASASGDTLSYTRTQGYHTQALNGGDSGA